MVFFWRGGVGNTRSACRAVHGAAYLFAYAAVCGKDHICSCAQGHSTGPGPAYYCYRRRRSRTATPTSTSCSRCGARGCGCATSRWTAAAPSRRVTMGCVQWCSLGCCKIYAGFHLLLARRDSNLQARYMRSPRRVQATPSPPTHHVRAPAPFRPHPLPPGRSLRRPAAGCRGPAAGAALHAARLGRKAAGTRVTGHSVHMGRPRLPVLPLCC